MDIGIVLAIIFGMISGHVVALSFIRKEFYLGSVNIVLLFVFMAYQILKG
jgi:hypothetical protein